MKAYRPAIYFLLRYLGLYLLLNTMYAFYIDHYRPQADPLTMVIARQTAALLSAVDEPVTAVAVKGSINVPLVHDRVTVIEIYEGCNSFNVIVVFFCFLIAFRGPLPMLVKFTAIGVVTIYVMNLLRLAALYWIALYHPQQLYFFHKFFFTGIIYIVVFALWFLWIKNLEVWKTAQTA